MNMNACLRLWTIDSNAFLRLVALATMPRRPPIRCSRNRLRHLPRLNRLPPRFRRQTWMSRHRTGFERHMPGLQESPSICAVRLAIIGAYRIRQPTPTVIAKHSETRFGNSTCRSWRTFQGRIYRDKMTTLTDGQIAELRATVRGHVIARGDAEYDTARRVFNAMIDRRPALIVRCAGAADVMASVRFARDRGLVVSVRSGGHGVAGLAICDDGLVIDLSGMKTMRIRPRRRIARCDPGLTLAEFDRETEAFGLATTMGTISMTGITGLTLGGGLGWLMGKHGLACDNLISADVVTADGKLLVASEEENADLFWALRGGGGNFGVVTSLKFRLHDQGPVFAGLVAHAMTDCAAALGFLRDFAHGAPDELALMGAVLTLPDG